MLSIDFSWLTHNNIILAPALQGQVNKSLSSEYLSEDDLKVVQTQTDTLMNTHRLLKGHYLLGVLLKWAGRDSSFKALQNCFSWHLSRHEEWPHHQRLIARFLWLVSYTTVTSGGAFMPHTQKVFFFFLFFFSQRFPVSFWQHVIGLHDYWESFSQTCTVQGLKLIMY